jgi:hypothetical protein
VLADKPRNIMPVVHLLDFAMLHGAQPRKLTQPVNSYMQNRIHHGFREMGVDSMAVPVLADHTLGPTEGLTAHTADLSDDLVHADGALLAELRQWDNVGLFRLGGSGASIHETARPFCED